MEIVWYGLGCFRLSERGYPTIVTDPFEEASTGLHLPRAGVSVVTWSQLMDDPHEAHWPGLQGEIHTVASPGEYEIGGVFITGIASTGQAGAGVAQNVIFAINFEGVVVCHLGALGQSLTQAQIEPIGRVNVLLMPVGLSDGLTMTMASETVSLIEPDIVIPMQYATPGLTRGSGAGRLLLEGDGRRTSHDGAQSQSYGRCGAGGNPDCAPRTLCLSSVAPSRVEVIYATRSSDTGCCYRSGLYWWHGGGDLPVAQSVAGTAGDGSGFNGCHPSRDRCRTI